MSFIRERKREWGGVPRKSRTFTARAFAHDGRLVAEETRKTVSSAMDAVKDACSRGYSVTVRGEFTSDGTRWRGNRGRVWATCENKRWVRY